MPTRMFVGNAKQNGATDYDEEARKLWARLDSQPASRFNNLDPLHRSKEGGFIYVGGDLRFAEWPCGVTTPESSE